MLNTLNNHADLKAAEPVCWINENRDVASLEAGAFLASDVTDAAADWVWFAPVLAKMFPETAAVGGRVSSALQQIPSHVEGQADWLVKCDHDLPGTGCIKARGGVYEVLVRARQDYPGGPPENASDLLTARAHYSKRRILVGSTGNLAFSVGVAARFLGYQVEVHMSHDAKQWKKDRLTAMGARVVEHTEDYSYAVEQARSNAAKDPNSYFIDDENSPTLFRGYSAAALEIADQLSARGINIGPDTPLEVYLPCGVGGAPGGVAFGLASVFGDAVRPIIVEPVASPCMLAQLMHDDDQLVSVYDYGLDNQTIADGLAVAQASILVARELKRIATASVTVNDDDLFYWVFQMWDKAKLRLEPSAAAGFAACARFSKPLHDHFGGPEPVRVIWATGGSLLPDEEFNAILAAGQKLLSR